MGTIVVRRARESQAKQVTEDELAVVLAMHAATGRVMGQGVGHEDAADPHRQERGNGSNARPARHMRTKRHRLTRKPPDAAIEEPIAKKADGSRYRVRRTG